MSKVKAHPKKYIVQSLLLLIKQMKFKIYIRKLHWLPPGELQPPFFFAKTNTSCMSWIPHLLCRVNKIPPPEST